MSQSKRYYLARNQQVFGPLSQSQVQSLRENGLLLSYSWIWQEGEEQWSPVDPAPALPQIASTDGAGIARVIPLGASPQASPLPLPTVAPVVPVAAAPAAAPRARAHLIAQETFRIVLFDQRDAISGWLISASDDGCEIRSDQNGSDPHFVEKGLACLSLHDTRNGSTIKLKVRVSLVARAGGGWMYRVHWNEAPSILSHSTGSSRVVAA